MALILVTGGTGTLGRVVVGRLLAAGHAVRVVARRPPQAGSVPPDSGGGTRYRSVQVDLRTGDGLDAAVVGADAVVHCASTPGGGDTDAAGNLTAATRRAGVRHLAYISIVGVDRVPLPYYRTKLAVERLVEESGLGWTILRTTQFHDLAARLCAAAARLPVMPVPAFSLQPVDVREVAARLAGLAVGEPAGRVPDLGGPQVRPFTDLARAYLRAYGRRRAVVPVRLPGAVFRGYRAGGHLAPDRADGRITFEEYLAGTAR